MNEKRNSLLCDFCFVMIIQWSLERENGTVRQNLQGKKLLIKVHRCLIKAKIVIFLPHRP